MFDDEDHRRALRDFIAYLRRFSSQKDIAFFSDTSREYLRNLGKGARIPSVKVFFNIIEAAGLNPIEGAQKYLDYLRSYHVAIAAERNSGRNYIQTIKQGIKKPGPSEGQH